MDRDTWQQAEKLFTACVDLPGSARKRFLDDACQGKPALRRAVENLLEGDQRTALVEASIRRAARSAYDAKTDRFVGKRIGAYTIDSKIAEGGMGMVFMASRSDEAFQQRVAIKLLTTTITGEEMRSRFVAERQILASLSHPNIAALLDGGETVEDIPYLVMELVDGLPINDYCERNALPLPHRLRLFQQVCGAVQYAHRNLIVHRDIKPANILVTPDGVPKLLDFGIAKLLDPERKDAELTRVGGRIMTPRHASPEQVLGVAVTTASDVYSLGVLLYELVSGELPYDIDGNTRPSAVEKFIVDEMPPPPGARMDTACSSDIDAIVLKALRKEPSERYRSPGDLADDLDRYLNSLPVEARPLTIGYSLTSFWRRHKALSIATGLALIAVLAGTGAALTGLMHARNAEQVALTEAETSKAVSDFLVGVFTEADPHVASGDEATVSEVLEAGSRRIVEELGESPVVRARILETLSSVYKARGDYMLAISQLTEALDLVANATPENLVARARMLNDLGDLYRIRDEYEQSRLYLEEAARLHDRFGPEPTPDRGDNANNLGLLYQAIGESEMALASFSESLRIRESLFEAPHPTIANSLHNLAWYFGQVDGLEQAASYGEQAVAMRTELFGEAHGLVAGSLFNLVRVYLRQGQLEKALATATKCQDIHVAVYGESHGWTLGSMHWKAMVLHEAGRLLEAYELWRSVHELSAANEDTLPFDHASAQRFLGRILLDLGNYDAAEALLRTAQAEFDKPDIPVVHSRGLNRTRLAEALLVNRKTAEAGELLLPGGDFSLPDLARSDADMARQVVLAEYLRQADRKEEALAFIRQVIAGFSPASGFEQVQLADALRVQGRILLDVGPTEDAVSVLTEALRTYEEARGAGYWKAALVKADLGMAELERENSAAALALLRSARSGLTGEVFDSHPVIRRIDATLTSIADAD